jgi:hypothetical protein
MPRSIKITIAVCVALVLLVLLAPLILGIRHGAPWIPETPPVETQRVFHPRGFSVIPPPGWVVKFVADSIIIGPGSKKVRYAPGFGITRLDYAPELSEFHKTAFLEMEAYEMTRPASGHGDVTYLIYHLLVRHDDHWYEISYSLPNGSFDRPARSTVPDTMMLYIHSFRPRTNSAANKALELTRVGALGSAVAAYVTGPAWLSYICR